MYSWYIFKRLEILYQMDLKMVHHRKFFRCAQRREQFHNLDQSTCNFRLTTFASRYPTTLSSSVSYSIIVASPSLNILLAKPFYWWHHTQLMYYVKSMIVLPHIIHSSPPFKVACSAATRILYAIRLYETVVLTSLLSQPRITVSQPIK